MYSYCVMRVWNYDMPSVAQNAVNIIEINHEKVNCVLGIIVLNWLNLIFHNEKIIFTEVAHNIILVCGGLAGVHFEEFTMYFCKGKKKVFL
jgi:hypothetical protein